MAGPPAKLHLPFDQWPQIDRRLWADATADDDPFADAPAARLAKATLHSRWMGWRRFLGFLSATDPDALGMAPAQRVTLDRVRKFARHVGETNTPRSLACQIDALYGAVRMMLPKQDWTWLRDLKKRLFVAAPPPRRGPVITSMQLLDVGLALMKEANVAEGESITLDRAVKYRDGLMIAMLAYIPVRHKNFAAMEIGRDFVEEDGKWCFIIPPAETKTKVPIDFEIPPEMAGQLTNYLRVVRPRLLRQPGCDALWVSAKGGRLSYSAVGPVVTRHTAVRLGVRVTPHDARDAAATFWAIMSPGQIGVARDLLAHERLGTTNKYYNRARGVEASRRQAQLIAKMRRK